VPLLERCVDRCDRREHRVVGWPRDDGEQVEVAARGEKSPATSEPWA